MADNVPVTAGSGTTIATDDVSTVHFQKVKLADGAADSSAMIGGDATNGLDVDVTRAPSDKAEDAAHSTGATGSFILAVRNSAGAALTDTDGDYSPIGVTSTGAIQVDSSKTEDALHSSGGQGAFILGVRNDAAATLTSGDGDYSPIATDAAGRLITTSLNRTASSTITADEGTVPLIVADGVGTATLQITGTWTATLVWEATVDNTNWFSINALDPQNAALSTGSSANGEWIVPCAGYSQVRVRADAFTSGTVTVTWEGSTGAQAVIATDGGGSLTVDGSVTVSATDLDIRNLTTTDEVTVKGGAADGAAPVGNPVLIAGYDTTNVQSIHTDTSGDLQVDVLTMPSTTVTATDLDIRNLDVAQDDVRVGGMAAIDAAIADNPVLMGGRASTAQPTDVTADGRAQALWVDQKGSPVVTAAPHVGLLGEPWSLVHEAAQYTTTQTSTVLIAGGASEKIVVTKVQIQVGGTTAGTLQLYFGTGAFSRGTSRAIFDGEFAPSATLKPGVVMDGPFISGTNGDDLMVTDSAAINPLTINVWYYVVT